MSHQRPVQEKGRLCPLLKQDVSKVCHKCEWFQLVRGKHPQSEEMLDEWGCAIAWAPMLLINAAQAAHQGAAETAKFRNAVIDRVQRPALLRNGGGL